MFENQCIFNIECLPRSSKAQNFNQSRHAARGGASLNLGYFAEAAPTEAIIIYNKMENFKKNFVADSCAKQSCDEADRAGSESTFGPRRRAGCVNFI